MVTTISVSSKRQVVLPKAFCERKKIKAGTSLRVVEIAEGLYVSPVSEPSAKEMNEVVAAAERLHRRVLAGDAGDGEGVIGRRRQLGAQHAALEFVVFDVQHADRAGTEDLMLWALIDTPEFVFND